MNTDSNQFWKLRESAIEALARGELGHDQQLGPDAPSREKLLEELRVYHAELEIQNAELSALQRQSERNSMRFETLFDALPLSAVVIDHGGIIQEANTRAVSMFGFRSPAAMRQHSLYRLIDPGNLNALLHRAKISATNEPIIVRSTRTQSAKRRTIDLELHVSRLSARFHMEEHLLIIFVDRTAERLLEQERLLLQSLIDRTSALIYAFDRDGLCILANRKLQDFLGVDGGQLIGQRRDDWNMPEFESRNEELQDANVLATGKPLVQEARLLSPQNNKSSYHLCEKFALRSATGEIYGVATIATDITEMRERDARLEVAMELFSKGTEGIIITDNQNNIISTNKAFEQITGYAETEVIGKNPSILKSGRHDRDFYKSMWSDIKEKGSWEGEIWNRRRNGETYPQWLNVSKVASDTLETEYYVAVFSDITHRKLAEEEIHRLAFFDTLTGTPNRHLLRDRVEQAIRISTRENSEFALCFLDLDHFKEVNDVYGHETGDKLLGEVVTRIRGEIRAQDTLSRLGGDEFVVLLPSVDRHLLPTRIKKILSRLTIPFEIDGHCLNVSASLGIALFPEDGSDFSAILKNADIAMYKAKAGGRNNFRFFNRVMAEDSKRRMHLETALRSAIDNNEISLRYQPQISLTTGRMIGVEALLRWQHPQLGWVQPDRFIPVAEDARLIAPIGNWVLNHALSQRKQWLDKGFGDFPVAVNVSSHQFWSENFVGSILDLLSKHGLHGSHLEIELTERVAMDNPEKAVEMMKALRSAGVRLSIDDFGTGYSSLAYLRWMPVNVLKIDKSFVTDIGIDPDDEAICCSIIELAATLGIQTVAEGVETPVHAKFLTEKKCNAAQGYHFAHPLFAEELQPWLENSQ